MSSSFHHHPRHVNVPVAWGNPEQDWFPSWRRLQGSLSSCQTALRPSIHGLKAPFPTAPPQRYIAYFHPSSAASQITLTWLAHFPQLNDGNTQCPTTTTTIPFAHPGHQAMKTEHQQFPNLPPLVVPSSAPTTAAITLHHTLVLRCCFQVLANCHEGVATTLARFTCALLHHVPALSTMTAPSSVAPSSTASLALDLEAWLKAHGLWCIVSGSSMRPVFREVDSSPQVTGATAPAQSAQSAIPSAAQQELCDAFEAKCAQLQEAWDAKSDKAAGWIWLTLEQDQKTLVDGCRDDPKAMWTTLEGTYRQNRAGSRFNVYDDLFSIQKQEEKTLQTLINRVDEAMKLFQTLSISRLPTGLPSIARRMRKCIVCQV
ncbi:hypothetical protein DFP72DRAFT_1071997 [Ephemerocybe angulata]|uniref:Uncharacterized protein n=1 Tax=Ephemerocybe angulata TaxID=980116 RepID=A0A8H6M0G2_9AGAR|nr:hypothetical protein DFP72DRAFT_1071997 [Tulosesus angulatus]